MVVFLYLQTKTEYVILYTTWSIWRSIFLRKHFIHFRSRTLRTVFQKTSREVYIVRKPEDIDKHETSIDEHYYVWYLWLQC